MTGGQKVESSNLSIPTIFCFCFALWRISRLARSFVQSCTESTLLRSLPSQNATSAQTASQKAYVVPNVTLIRGNRNNRRHPPPAHGCCERVARERAGGERGFPRAGVAARGQKAECTRALRPRVKRLPYLIRLPLNAGRANKKSDISAYLSHRRRKRGAGKSVRRRQGYGGTSRGVSPRGAPKRPGGAGRGAAEPRRKALH